MIRMPHAARIVAVRPEASVVLVNGVPVDLPARVAPGDLVDARFSQADVVPMLRLQDDWELPD